MQLIGGSRNPKGRENIMSKIVGLAIVIFTGILSAIPAAAQGSLWAIDSKHSTARLYLASSKGPDATINVGVARLSGEVVQAAGDSNPSAFDFTIYPADENVDVTGTANKPGGENLPASSDYTVITFKSASVEPVSGTTIRVTGDMTITHVERIATYGPSESYGGPTYGPSVTRSATQRETLEFRRVHEADALGTKGGSVEWSATSTIPGEAFPELLNAVAAAAWPTFVVSEECTMPSNVGEDFSGPACTMETIDPAPRTDVQWAMPSSLGEDFAGEVSTGTPLQVVRNSAAGNNSGKLDHRNGDEHELVANEVKMELSLQLTGTESLASASSGH
jgi:polyisoprenoid-binding protein YceI